MVCVRHCAGICGFIRRPKKYVLNPALICVLADYIGHYGYEMGTCVFFFYVRLVSKSDAEIPTHIGTKLRFFILPCFVNLARDVLHVGFYSTIILI